MLQLQSIFFSPHPLLSKIPLVQLCHLPFSSPANLLQVHPTTAGAHPYTVIPSGPSTALHNTCPHWPCPVPAGSCLPSHRTPPLPPHIGPSALRILSSEIQPSPWLQIYTWQSLSQPVFGKAYLLHFGDTLIPNSVEALIFIKQDTLAALWKRHGKNKIICATGNAIAVQNLSNTTFKSEYLSIPSLSNPESSFSTELHLFNDRFECKAILRIIALGICKLLKKQNS